MTDLEMPLRIDRIPQGLRIRHRETVTQVRLLVEGVASVVSCPAERLAVSGGLFAAPAAPAPVVSVRDGDGVVLLSGGGVTVTASTRTGALSFADAAGTTLIAEADLPEPLVGLRLGSSLPSQAVPAAAAFTIGADEALHGLGQFRAAPFDYRDGDVFLAHSNSDAVNPFLVSTGGWGLLWDTGTAAHFRSRGTELLFQSVAGDLVRYHVAVGADLDGVIGGYRRLTGPAPLFGRWAYGYWQSQERYHDQGEVLAVIDGYRSRGLPLDAVVLDWRYWGEDDVFSGMVFDPQTFPDPVGMVDQIHARGAHVIASIWPATGENSAVHQELDAQGLLFPSPHWSGGRVYDATSAVAREIYCRHAMRGLIDVGIDGLWTDGSEPEFMSTGDRYWNAEAFAANGRSASGPICEHLLTFSYHHSMGLDQAMRRERPAKRPFILSRSAYAGQQAFGSVTWSGDVFASWQTLRDQLVAAQNFSLSGIPYWTCDIGGFLTHHRYPTAPQDPAYRELYVRWFQFGAMLPIFRAHGTEFRREVWTFGEAGDPVYDALEAMLRLRYALTPYIYSTAAAVTLHADTLLRPLVMDFPDDPDCRGRANQFMLGRQLMARVVDRPLLHASERGHEFLPHDAVLGTAAPGGPDRTALAAQVTYFEGADFQRPVRTRLTDDLKMGWFGDQPRELAGKPYSVRWTGRIAAAESGLHTFSVIGKGAIRLSLDGAVLVDGAAALHETALDVATSGDGSATVDDQGRTPFVVAQAQVDAVHTAGVELIAGTCHDFTLELRQPTPDVVSVWLEWLTPTQRALSQPPPRPVVEVYLPRGTDWFEFASGRRHSGGQTLEVQAPLGHLPLFARAGAIIPMTPGSTQAGLPIRALEITVFAGADGAFTLYDDEGDGDGYQHGAFATTPLTWSQADRTLTVGPRSGDYPGMPTSLPITVTLVDGSAGPAPIVTARFEGAALVLPLGQAAVD